MNKIKKIVYEKDYKFKIIVVFIFTMLMCIVGCFTEYYLVPMPTLKVTEYHMGILTINSILSGFSLTNLGILISISDDQLVKKLEGTDILIKRNVVISHSIIFGAISIGLSFLFVLNLNLSILGFMGKWLAFIKCFVFNLEIVSLCISIFYFLISIKKMIQLLSYIYVPKITYTSEKQERLKNQIEASKHNKPDNE